MTLYDDITKEVRIGLRVARNMVRRGLISVAPSAAYFLQAEGHEGETFEDVELWQQYGFASRPPTGGEVALLEMDGGSEQAVAVATQDRAHRPTLAAEEAALYGAVSGGTQPTVICKPNGDVLITSGDNACYVKVDHDGEIVLEPTGGEFVEVGDGATARMLLGETWDTDWHTQLKLLLADFKTWDGTPKAAANNAAMLDDIWNFFWALWQAAGGLGTKGNPASHVKGTDWLATKGKVK